MDRQTATQLIGNTFNFPFDEGKFRNFAINLFAVDESKGFPYLSGNYIRHSFKNHIIKYRRLGTYTDPDRKKVDVLVVQLKNERALERSRTMLRNFTSDYLKNRGEKDAALVAYYTTNPEDWRFSYIRMEYKREQTETGTFRIKQDVTPAKRYSFLVGANEPNHTAQVQLVGILADNQNHPTLAVLENAFSVEAVSKQFYQDYRSQFEKLWNELNDIVAKDQKIAEEFVVKTIDTANFAKKLMGQIVFLYFLQKKGWLGVGKDDSGNFKEWGTGPKNFLHRLYAKEFTDYGNFFNEVLEPLFYEALATERPNDIFSQFNCKIPFLNGGLFEPLHGYNWQESGIRIDNALIADLFKTFDQYNFTVREDEPLEKEVAVDPEMLGKVFENLLPENLRKGKGAYYTPRTIVHYMCQESLINYLDTTINFPLEKGDTSEEVSGCVVPKADLETLIREGDIILELETAIAEDGNKSKSVLMDSIKENAPALDDALATIKVCDPAIGSGAFPVGMLTEIVKARKVLEVYLDKKQGIYELKRHCIQNSLYGVDIDSGAIEIAKLRLWLSLVVDEDNYQNIQALPNLDYKIMQGNSLIEEFHGISLDLEKKALEQMNLFSGGSDLDALIDDLHRKQADFFNAEHPREKIKKREEVETAIYNIFHHELGKRQNVSPEEAKEIETDLKEMTHGNKERNIFPWKLYFADVFREKGGFDIVIANPPYVSIKGILWDDRRKYEKLFSIRGRFDLYILFILKILKICKENGEWSLIIPNKFATNSQFRDTRKLLLINNIINSILLCEDYQFEDVGVNSIVLVTSNTIPTEKDKISFYKIERNNISPFNIQLQSDLKKSNNFNIISITDRKSLLIFEKIKQNTCRYDTFFNVKDGIVAGGIKDKLFSEFQIDSNSHKLFFGRGLKPFSLQWTGKWVNYKPTEMMDLEIKIKQGKRPGLWLRNREIFKSRKILTRKVAAYIIASLDESGIYYEQTIHGSLINNDYKHYDLKYFVGILNSTLIKNYYKSIVQQEGKLFPQVRISVLKSLPIYPIEFEDKFCFNIYKQIVDIVDKILTAKKANPQADTTALEAEIDRLVYELYDLTEEEIQIVEESVK